MATSSFRLLAQSRLGDEIILAQILADNPGTGAFESGLG